MSPDRDKRNEVRLSTLWNNMRCQNVNLSNNLDGKSSRHFVTERSKVHTIYILEQEKSKRLGLILSVVLLLAAMLIIMFAPKEKEIVSYWLGAALVIFSAGAAGYKRIWAKAPLIEVDAGE